MVKNIPNPEDYFYSGKELFNFSWDIVAKLLTDLDEAHYFDLDKDEISDKYWESSRSSLTTALAVIQQGVELILKGRIAQVSPFLLIADGVSKWPPLVGEDSLDFSEFRTIDAQDLVKAHNTFSIEKLGDDFVGKFNEMRIRRNSIVHSVHKELKILVTDIFESLLYMHKYFFPDENWSALRIAFLRNSPAALLGDWYYASNRICWEMNLVIDLLKPAEVKKYFDVNANQRKYLCPICLYGSEKNSDFDYKLAELRPKAPGSTSLFCPVCSETSKVEREDCQDNDCRGDVLSEEGQCLTCSGYNEE